MSSHSNPTIDIRRRISQDLCRSILWVDEEIFSYTTNQQGEKKFNYDTFHDLFQPVTQELQDAGYLVHLHSFEQSTEEDGFEDEFSAESPSLKSAKELSKKADIIILDWHLGSADSPENSIKILGALLENPATRIVLILSKNSDRFKDELAESGFSSLTWDEKSSSWTTGNGLHLKVLSKKPNGTERITADEIIGAVFSLFSEHYPDYLHWAALEIAEKIRSHVPEWLHSLTSGTDLAVLQELLDEGSEIRSYLPQNLLENLVYIASANRLKSLDGDNTKREFWGNRPSFVQNKVDSKIERYINVIKSSKKLRDDLPDILTNLADYNGGDQWLEAHQRLIEFCEVLPLMEALPSPGAVYMSTTSGESNGTVFICVSQECDCIRSTPLLFVRALPIDEVKPNSTSFRFEGTTYRIDSRAENLLQLPVEEDRSIGSYKKIGQIRPQIAARIISRYWSGTTRPAVNHPTFARALRSEEA